MKFRYIKPDTYDDEGEIILQNSYGGNKVKKGDIVDLPVHFAAKAAISPHYEEVKAKKRKPKQEEIVIDSV